MSESSDRYTAALKIDDRESERYYAASLNVKTEQQKQIEELLRKHGLKPARIADIACGGGTASHHLGAMFPHAGYTLVDLNDEAIELARKATERLQASCIVGNIYDLPLDSDGFDLVICWQTLSWLGEPERALRELIRICKPGGRVYASYNTYAVSTLRRWAEGPVSDLEVHEFCIPVDLRGGFLRSGSECMIEALRSE